MKKHLFHGFRLFILIVIAVMVLLPIFWMVMSSFRSQSEIFRFSHLSWHLFFPKDWTLKNYVEIFTSQEHPFGHYIVNTLFVALTITFLGLLVNSIAAFAFAKLRFPFKKPLLILFLSTLAIPPEVLMLPQYLLMNDLGWLNQYKALIIPQIAWAFGVFLLVQFFKDLPRDILDAAKIDGASWLRVYFKIAIPSAIPALITLGLVTFMTQWDNFLWALVVMNDDSKQVITVGINSYQSLNDVKWGNVMAASSISSIPIAIVFLFLQRYYVRGFTISGVKG